MVSHGLRSVRVDGLQHGRFSTSHYGMDDIAHIWTSVAPVLRLHNHLTAKTEASSDDLIG